MGKKGERQSAAGAQFSEDVLPRLAPLGAVTSKKMFGGYGVFQNGNSPASYPLLRVVADLRDLADRATSARIPGLDLELTLEAGDEIRTEISAKYTRASFADRMEGTGLRIEQWFTDPDELFSLALLGIER